MARFIVIVATLLVASVAGAADFRLRSEAKPQGPVVRMGDVAEVFAVNQTEAQQLADIELVPAPAAGKQRQLSVREIQDTLERRGMNMLQCHFTGANQVTLVSYAEPAKPALKTKPTSLSQSSMQEAERAVTAAIVKHLQEVNGAGDPWTIDVDLTDAQAQSVLANAKHLEVRGGAAPWVGAQQFDIVVPGDKEPVVFSLTAQVGIPEAVVATVKPVPKGSIIAADDVTLVRDKSGAAVEGAFRSLDEVIGHEAVMAIAPGQVLDSQYVRMPLMVKRGSVVTVYALAPGVKVRTTARSREDGSRGDTVTVESLLDRKTFLAKVTGIDQVEVNASTVTAVDAPGPAPATADGNARWRKPAAVTRLNSTKPARIDKTMNAEISESR
jgi:flagella basal body P-ring formation protein FlgA